MLEAAIWIVAYLTIGFIFTETWYVPEVKRLASENNIRDQELSEERKERESTERSALRFARALMTIGWFPCIFIELLFDCPIFRLAI
ncbi:MAG: hypothetical protein V1885_00555 [Candidatus Brennerbacteria bacterium]